MLRRDFCHTAPIRQVVQPQIWTWSGIHCAAMRRFLMCYSASVHRDRPVFSQLNERIDMTSSLRLEALVHGHLPIL
jgi:hypothetical protein